MLVAYALLPSLSEKRTLYPRARMSYTAIFFLLPTQGKGAIDYSMAAFINKEEQTRPMVLNCRSPKSNEPSLIISVELPDASRLKVRRLTASHDYA